MRSFTISHRTRATTLASGLAILASVTAAIHCGSDDEPPNNASSAGKSGSAGTSDTAGTSGSNGASGSQGTAGSGGTAGGDASIDPKPDGGGESGDADASDAAIDTFDPTVQGSLKTSTGAPVPGISVVIGNSVAVSDSDGEFVLTNVPASYDLLILQTASGGGKLAELYVGLTTRRPIVAPAMADPANRSATLSGTVKPETGFPQSVSQRTQVGFSFAGQPYRATFDIEGDAGPAFGPIRVSWTGNEAIVGQLHALRWSYGSTRLPTGYLAWGVQPLTLANGGTPSTTITLGTVGQQETAGTVRFPPLRELAATIEIGQINVLSAAVAVQSGATTAPYRYLIPTGVGDVEKILTFHGNVTLANSLSSETRVRLKDSTTTLDVELIAPAAQALPVSGATGVDVNTEFAWSSVPNAVYRLIANSPQNFFLVYTAATRARLPDALAKGIPFAAGTYTWAVSAQGPARTTDDLVTGKTLMETNDTVFSTSSTSRQFTARAP